MLTGTVILHKHKKKSLNKKYDGGVLKMGLHLPGDLFFLRPLVLVFRVCFEKHSSHSHPLRFWIINPIYFNHNNQGHVGTVVQNI